MNLVARVRTALVVAALVAGGAAQAQSADDILAKYFEVTGQEKMNKVTSRTSIGKVTFGPQEIPITMYAKRPNKMRLSFVLQGKEMTQMAYDGKDAWRFMPMYSMEVQDIAGDDLKDLIEEADFDDAFYKYKDKGHTVEYMGEEEVEGTKAHKLKLTRKSGNTSYWYFDAEAYVPLKAISKIKRQGAEIEQESIFSNYQQIDGMLVAMSQEIRQVGAPQGQKITLEKVDFSTEINDSVFSRPTNSATGK